MPRSLSIVAACLVALIFCAPGRSQDTPSLGDLARQAQKDKSKQPAKKVFTNDDVSSGGSSSSVSSGNGITSSGMGSIAAPAPAAAGQQSAPATAEQAAGQLEGLINKLDSLNRADLVKGALQGMDVDFPGRGAWEQRLVSAKQTYVARGRDLLKDAERIQSMAQSLKGTQDPNDPRVKDLMSRLQGLVQDGTRLDASFQAVILEGRDLAGQVQGH